MEYQMIKKLIAIFTLFFSFIDLFGLVSLVSFNTLTKTTVVIRNRLDKSSRDPVDSDFNGTFSAIPPVKSLKPSKVVPYLSASYDPWSLKGEDNTGYLECIIHIG